MREWTQLEPIVGAGGEVGGDIALTDAVNARWVQEQPDGTCRQVTRNFFGAQAEDGLKPAFVIEQTEYMLWDRAPVDGNDPQEVWSDYRDVVAAATFEDDEQLLHLAECAEFPTDDEWDYAEAVRYHSASWWDCDGLIPTWDYL